MNLIDKMVSAYQNNEVMPLKGKATIELTNIRTGKRERIESENMVTNAVADILSKNMCGLGQFSTLLPLKKLFGGVLLFGSNITENADNYNIPSDQNKCFAWAGDTAHSTANPYRGNPNGGETVETDNSIAFVWDWATNQGNTGEDSINCVCLTHANFGNMGTKPWDATINPFSTFGGDSVTGNYMSETKSYQYPFTIDADGQTAKTLYLDGTTFKETTVKHDYFKFGILRTARDWTVVSNRTATVSAGSNRVLMDDDTYYYVVRATDSTTLAIDKVKKSDMTVTSTTLSVAGVSLYTGTISTQYGAPHVYRTFPFDGTYIYWPNSDRTKMIRVNISNAADVAELDGTAPIGAGVATERESNGGEFVTPIVLSPGLVIGANYIINDDHLYHMLHTAQIFTQNQYYSGDVGLDLIRTGAACYGNSCSFYDDAGRTTGQGNVLCGAYLATINNLGSAVQKGSAQTMKVRYTLTEV